MDISFILSVPEEMWSANGDVVHPDIQDAIAEGVMDVFGNDIEYAISGISLGAGASAEAILLYITAPFTIVGGIAGLWFFAEKVRNLAARFRSRNGHISLPEKEAFLASIREVLQREDLERIRMLQAMTIKTGSEDARLGGFPFCYVYVIGLYGDVDDGDDVHILLVDENGIVLIHEKAKLRLFLQMFGSDKALVDFLGL